MKRYRRYCPSTTDRFPLFRPYYCLSIPYTFLFFNARVFSPFFFFFFYCSPGKTIAERPSGISVITLYYTCARVVERQNLKRVKRPHGFSALDDVSVYNNNTYCYYYYVFVRTFTRVRTRLNARCKRQALFGLFDRSESLENAAVTFFTYFP